MIDDLLAALAAARPLPAGPREQPLASLWDRLCHQGLPDPVSFAAVPDLVDIAGGAGAGERLGVLHLIGSIAAAEPGPAAAPAQFRSAYDAALARAQPLVDESLQARRDDARAVLQLLADGVALAGERALARAIMVLDSGELELRCRCGHALPMLGAGADGLEIEPLRWAPGPAAPAAAEQAERARRLGHPAAARQLEDLGRAVLCPSCAAVLPIVDAAITW